MTIPLARFVDGLVARDARPQAEAARGGRPEPALLVEGVHKSFDKLEVLRGIDLHGAEHEVVCLIGASGSGKSTLLRCINLLEPIDAGGSSWATARSRPERDSTDPAADRHRLPGLQPLPAHDRARERDPGATGRR